MWFVWPSTTGIFRVEVVHPELAWSFAHMEPLMYLGAGTVCLGSPQGSPG